MRIISLLLVTGLSAVLGCGTERDEPVPAGGMELAVGPEIPIVQAVVDGDQHEVRRLIESGVAIDTVSTDGISLLGVAAKTHDEEMFQILIDLGANVNAYDERGFVPLVYALYHGNPQAVDLLIKSGADLNLARSPKNEGALLVALMGLADQDTIPDLVSLLIDAGADATERSYNGMTAIQWVLAAMPHNLDETRDVVTLLLREGVDVNAQDDTGDTALHQAISKWDTSKPGVLDNSVVRLLLDNGADPEIRNMWGMTPLLKICIQSQPPAIRSEALQQSVVERLELLISNGADPNSAVPEGYPGGQTGLTALYGAVEHGMPEYVAALIERGARIQNGSERVLILKELQKQEQDASDEEERQRVERIGRLLEGAG